jgi:hypothetical protein
LSSARTAIATARRKRSWSEPGEVHAAEVAAAVGRQELLAAGIAGDDRLAVREVVVLVDPVDEDHARLGMIVGRAHDLVPQVASGNRLVDPCAIAALPGARVAEGLLRVNQVERRIGLHGPHERVRHRDGHVEVAERAVVLGVDELLDIRMVHPHHAHLRAASRTCRLQRFARLVEDPHVGHRARSARQRALHQRAARTDGGEIVADAAAAAHRLGRLLQGQVDARPAFRVATRNRITDRLDEAVDQGGVDVGAGGGIDAARRHEAVLQRPQEFPLPVLLASGRLDRRERTSHAHADVARGLLVTLCVLFTQHVEGDFLVRQGS